ncbi:MAG: MoxR family ATPase [Planctomycetota bacterium]|jgi:MoxR-like ATPase|nr:MoxR family ATPase [Planctomycetota bacterium]
MVSEVDHDIADLESNISRVLLGKPETVRLAVITLLAEGHLLIEDVPGVGKTLLARAMARSVNGRFCRIQFTPDLLPSDIVGSSIFNSNRSEFSFSQGPLFANIVLADEINRTPPRTQSALLEAMNDRQVSVDGTTHALPDPFFVIATQNPYEFEGTYLLPESQLDRFLMCIRIGYPDREEEMNVLTSHRTGEPVDQLEPVIDSSSLVNLQKKVREIRVEKSINEYILDVVDATRHAPEISVGISPRGSLALYRAAQSLAMLEQRDYVIPDDVKQLAIPVLSHRLILHTYQAERHTEAAQTVMQHLLDDITVPS